VSRLNSAFDFRTLLVFINKVLSSNTAKFLFDFQN